MNLTEVVVHRRETLRELHLIFDGVHHVTALFQQGAEHHNVAFSVKLLEGRVMRVGESAAITRGAEKRYRFGERYGAGPEPLQADRVGNAPEAAMIRAHSAFCNFRRDQPNADEWAIWQAAVKWARSPVGGALPWDGVTPVEAPKKD